MGLGGVWVWVTGLGFGVVDGIYVLGLDQAPLGYRLGLVDWA